MVCIATITFFGYRAYKKQGASAEAALNFSKLKYVSRGSVDGRCVKFVEMGARNAAPGIKFHSPF